jgi:hypothetical protein
MAALAILYAWMSLSEPPKDPMAVRQADTMTTSFMVLPPEERVQGPGEENQEAVFTLYPVPYFFV